MVLRSSRPFLFLKRHRRFQNYEDIALLFVVLLNWMSSVDFRMSIFWNFTYLLFTIYRPNFMKKLKFHSSVRFYILFIGVNLYRKWIFLIEISFPLIIYLCLFKRFSDFLKIFHFKCNFFAIFLLLSFRELYGTKTKGNASFLCLVEIGYQ